MKGATPIGVLHTLKDSVDKTSDGESVSSDELVTLHSTRKIDVIEDPDFPEASDKLLGALWYFVESIAWQPAGHEAGFETGAKEYSSH